MPEALADSGKTRTAAIRCLMSRRLAGLLARQRFPRYRAAFGYGSAVIPQRSTAAPALVDAVLCVDDARAWHAANVLRNPAHYSWLKTLGPAAIATMGVELGAPIALLGRRSAVGWSVMAFGFHVGITVFMAILFPYQLLGVALAPLLPVERLDRSVRWASG